MLEGQLLRIAVVVVPVPGMINHVEPELVASASFPGDVATNSTTYSSTFEAAQQRELGRPT